MLERVSRQDDGTIPVRELKPGQVAEIVAWRECDAYVGHLVYQPARTGSLVSLSSKEWWDHIPVGDNCRVRVLPDGVLLRTVHQET